tara:strand:+ start:4646 stop:4933 length:288 start_codon:yes stop_codon:yes gene_type:complete
MKPQLLGKYAKYSPAPDKGVFEQNISNYQSTIPQAMSNARNKYGREVAAGAGTMYAVNRLAKKMGKAPGASIGNAIVLGSGLFAAKKARDTRRAK